MEDQLSIDNFLKQLGLEESHGSLISALYLLYCECLNQKDEKDN